MPIPAAVPAFFRRWRRVLLVLTALYGLWLLVGFFVIPRIIRGRAEQFATEFLHRKVTLQKVRFNPILFTARLEGLRVPNRDGSEWITLRRLFLDYRLHRLISKTIDLAALELDGLTVRVDLDAQGQPNFQDLLETPKKEEKPAEATPSSWAFAIGRFELKEGQLHFTDRSQATPFRTALGPVNLRVDGIRTEVGQHSGFAFEAWTEAREHLAFKGDLTLQPLASKGSLLVENLSLPKYRPYEQEQVSSEIRSGTASLHAQYRFEWGEKRHVVEVSELDFSLRDVKVAERGVVEPAIEVPSLDVRQGRMDLLKPSVEVGSITADLGVLRLQKAKEGGLNLARLFAPTKPKEKKADEKPVQLLVKDIALRGFRVGWEDLSLARPLKVEARDLNLHWQDLSLDPAAKGQASLDLKVENGSLKVAGSLAPLNATGDLTVKAEGFDLGTWDPYLDSALDLRIASGKLGLDGRVRFAFEGRTSDGITYLGGASVQGLEVRDAKLNEPFLRWKQLAINGADLRTAPLAVAIKTVDWTDIEGRLVVQPDGSTNVARALRLEQGAKAHSGANAKPAPVTASVIPATPAAAPDISIAKVGIAGGRLSFIDRSVQPNAALVLSDLEGSYLGLSSHPEAASKVLFKGKAGGLAPITISGRAMPLRNDLDTDVALRIQGADLTDFTPYTGKYLGYTVQKGKLDVDARLRIDHRKLKSENAVKLDQFFLGDKVESPEATHLPVKLGLAILRDRKGVIGFDLPVEGSLDDPDVKYGKLVWKAIFGLLGKIATSPFTAIGHLFGSDAGDPSVLTFTPGTAALDAAATAKLQGLAKALVERPALRLEAEGAVDADQDGAALRRAAFEALLRQTRRQGLGAADDTPVPATERERWVRAAFESAFPAPKPEKGAQPVPPPPLAEMEQRLLSRVTVDPAALDQLADARAKAVLGYLLNTAKADPERVFEVQTGKAKGAAVVFSLK
ncbi:DUF748 domain-containing protein [Geothrix sp. PMB-07]|uniref:DUF748 domain-containing protein n=1 Tax=Geothrix sp. PMB-07 TaxID=3068640 RepID=UPI00274293AB|nr:DUF748 domain-containing protein [Geothrix sp. PMB-07]WLT32373.1 DUF748 domain-containing protein [Geothrix sp. PMB-07]